MVAAYWEIGRVIVEEEQWGQARADYGEQLLANLADRLTNDFGKGYDRTNLHRMRLFYLAYPIRGAVRQELSWTSRSGGRPTSPPGARGVRLSIGRRPDQAADCGEEVVAGQGR